VCCYKLGIVTGKHTRKKKLERVEILIVRLRLNFIVGVKIYTLDTEDRVN
jgi:hypothetical protein